MTAATVRAARITRLGPHAVLAGAVAVVLAAEWGYDRHTSDAWIFLQALAGAVALIHAWRVQDRLRLGPVLALAFAFNAGWVALHLGLHVRGDFDSRHVYNVQGESLLHGNYPRSEYPVGAVPTRRPLVTESAVANSVTSTPRLTSPSVRREANCSQGPY